MEALAGTFNAQNVSNTLWAYATMRQEPGKGVMMVLEGRAEALASTFNEQDVANTPVHDGQTSPHKPRLFKLSKHHQYPDVRMRPEMTPIVCTLMVKDLLNYR